MLTLVARQENVFPAGESFPSHYGHPDVVFVPLYGWPPATRTLVWRTQSNSATVGAFIDTATASAPTPRSRLGAPGYGDWSGPRDLC